MIKKLFLSVILISSVLCAPKKIILDDTLSPTIDKISHSTTSFGLYYTFRYFRYNELKSIAMSFGVGLAYEIYQIYDPFEEEYFRGVSLHDILYNLFGIGIAFTLDKIITKTQKKQSKLKKSQSTLIANSSLLNL